MLVGWTCCRYGAMCWRGGLIHHVRKPWKPSATGRPMRRPRFIFEKERTAVAISVFDSMVSWFGIVVLGRASKEFRATATARSF